MRRDGSRRWRRSGQAAMKSVECHRRFILGIELLQALHARTGIVLGFVIGMQRGYQAAIRLLEFRQVTARAHPELPVQVEKIDLVNHALSPVAWWWPRIHLVTPASAVAPA
jgi:hypothetical protein